MEQQWKIIHPWGKLTIGSMLILSGLLSMNLARISSPVGQIAVGVLLLIPCISTVINVRRILAKRQIRLGETHMISTRAKRYEASQLEAIYMTPFKIGVKVKGKRLVPMDLCFYFDNDHEFLGKQALRAWAKQNGIPVSNQSFVMWW
ncbi:hypothetical protein [Gorillibacterium sp. CAU 1737]|uniref:hypothetical protein n=1 Tax=Gorillibacterium sp. CAU 1737 TaxID=3140362 RepID=UPI0032602B9E